MKFIIVLLIAQSCTNQKYDSSLVSKSLEINLADTKMRGIENNGTIYFLEEDLQTLSAYENGIRKWKTNVISVCGKPSVGKPEIRYLKLKPNILLVIFGKHSFAEIGLSNGETKFVGSD